MTQAQLPTDLLKRRLGENRTFIVIGAGGFLGRCLTDRLISLGHRVRALSISSGFDVRKDELPHEPVDHVFHLAARTGVAEAWRDPTGFFEVNALGTFRVLNQCRDRGYPICYVSSHLYDKDVSDGATESDLIKPENPYALSKHIGEQICTFFGSHLDLQVVILRPANIYGPGQSKNFLIPHIIAQLVDTQTQEIVVQDLAPRRDYIHVADVVDGLLLATTAPAGSVFNLGSGAAYSVEEVILCARKIAGSQKSYRAIGACRAHEIVAARMDVTAARQALGWEPKISLARGLRSVIESIH